MTCTGIVSVALLSTVYAMHLYSLYVKKRCKLLSIQYCNTIRRGGVGERNVMRLKGCLNTGGEAIFWGGRLSMYNIGLVPRYFSGPRGKLTINHILGIKCTKYDLCWGYASPKTCWENSRRSPNSVIGYIRQSTRHLWRARRQCPNLSRTKFWHVPVSYVPQTVKNITRGNPARLILVVSL